MGIKFSHAKVNRRQHYFVIQLNKVLKLILNSVIRLIGYTFLSVVILILFTLFILRANELKTGFIALGTKKTKNLPRSEARNQIRKK